MDDFMLMMMESDFNVSILSKNEDSALMAGIRITHYHFLEYKTKFFNPDNQENISEGGFVQNTHHQGVHNMNIIHQHHIPKYQLALSFDMLFRTKWNEPDRPLVAELSNRIWAAKFSEEKYAFIIGNVVYHLKDIDNNLIFSEIKKDVKRLNNANNLIRWDDGKCYLNDFNTINGSPIESPDGNDSLIQAIGFELKLFKEKRVKPRLGLYTLYSVMQDERYTFEAKQLKEYANGLTDCYLNSGNNYFLELIYRIQKSYFKEPVFNNGVIPDNKNVFKQIKLAYQNLKPYQKVILHQLYPVNGITFLVCYAFICDEIDLYEFNDMINKGYQPDSKVEQQNRYETNVLKLFGSFFK